MQQNFPAVKYVIKQHSALPKINLSYLKLFYFQFLTAIENIGFEICLRFI